MCVEYNAIDAYEWKLLIENKPLCWLRNFNNVFLIRYADLYNNADQPLAAEHRDTVLEILSDASIAAPLLNVGLLHSKVNPRSYMYVFGHNSRAGEYAKVSLYLKDILHKKNSICSVTIANSSSIRRALWARTCPTCLELHLRQRRHFLPNIVLKNVCCPNQLW